MECSTIARSSLLCLMVGCGRSDLMIVGPHPCELAPEDCVFEREVLPQADILFIVDDSRSMSREQAALARSFPAFLDVLENAELGLSYRIAITNTDGQAELQLSSCRSRLDTFVYATSDPENRVVDRREEGCLAVCDHEDLATTPTTASTDSLRAPRPWLQREGATLNLPAGLTMPEALACAGPQGLVGHAYEKPMATAARFVEHTGIESGFLRSGALFAAVIVTDETDCSWRGGHRPEREASEALWTDPEDPDTGLCWNAGMTCSGGPGVYDECRAVDRDLSGGLASEGESVLTPVGDIVNTLKGYGEDKARVGGNPDVLVSVIAGVPEGWPDSPLVFRDSDDPEVTNFYGIGPGCGFGLETKWDPTGLPPLRLIELAAGLEPFEGNVHSICAEDYSGALQSFAEAIGRIRPVMCVNGCVADRNPRALGLQPDCEVIEHWVDEDGAAADAPVPPCRLDAGDGSVSPFPGDENDICYRARALDPEDDGLCDVFAGNLVVSLEHRPGAASRDGSRVVLGCQLELPEGLPCNFEWQHSSGRPR